MHVVIAGLWWPLLSVAVLGSIGAMSMFVKPKMRDQRLDRTFADKPGKYDNPAQRFRR